MKNILGGGKRLNNYNYLLLLIKIWTREWDNQFEMMNMREDEKNGKYLVRGRIRKFRKRSSNEYCDNMVCIILEPTFDVGGYRLWEKEEGGMYKWK